MREADEDRGVEEDRPKKIVSERRQKRDTAWRKTWAAQGEFIMSSLLRHESMIYLCVLPH